LGRAGELVRVAETQLDEQVDVRGAAPVEAFAADQVGSRVRLEPGRPQVALELRVGRHRFGSAGVRRVVSADDCSHVGLGGGHVHG
jgi:hypothetical protein